MQPLPTKQQNACIVRNVHQECERASGIRHVVRTSSGRLYAAPKNFADTIVFLGFSKIVKSAPKSKFSTTGGFSFPSRTVKVLSFGIVANVVTAATKAFRLINDRESFPRELELHI
jgi:hypothetical protein